MNSSEKTSDEPSPKIRFGPTIYWDVEGLDAKTIAQVIHLVFRFHAKGIEICGDRKENDAKNS